MKKKDFFWVTKTFLIWRLFLELVIIFASKYIKLQENFLGIVPWANFDAEHYISIARFGYKPLQYFYFPIYPLFINRFVNLLQLNDVLSSYVYSGLIISHLAFFTSLIGFYKLVSLKFDEKVAKLSIVLLLFFPTSYYFASVYTESLFLMFVVWSFYFFEKKDFLKSGILGGLASATRTTGIILLPAFLISLFINKRLEKGHLLLLLIPLGLVSYMYFLELTTDNPFSFNEHGFIFGEYRSSNPVLLPQVFYRYIFKILPSLPSNYFPVLFTTWLEFLSATFVTFFLTFSFKKKLSHWWIYALGGFIAPTLYLNFVSMPRYTLVLFPVYVYLASFLHKKNLPKYLYILISCVSLVIALSLFSRGYWVS